VQTDGTVVAATRARKTANSSAHAYGINVGVTVDTHVKRLSYRLIDC